jgi:hypothetical protein
VAEKEIEQGAGEAGRRKQDSPRRHEGKKKEIAARQVAQK